MPHTSSHVPVGRRLLLVGAALTLAAGLAACGDAPTAPAPQSAAQSAATAATPDGWSDDLSVSTSGDRVEVEMTAPTLIPIMEDFAFTIPADAGIVEEPQ